ncbi:MAG TPA: hypothetical protein VGI21_06335, partial [Streptosporangiaceae bacterium]
MGAVTPGQEVDSSAITVVPGACSATALFSARTNATVYKRVPGATTIAEESTSWPGVTRPTHLGGLGFG